MERADRSTNAFDSFARREYGEHEGVRAATSADAPAAHPAAEHAAQLDGRPQQTRT